MDFFNLMTIVALGLSSFGVANIYEGKTEGDKQKFGKGVLSLAVGVLSVCWLNPIFPRSMFFSIIFAVAVTLFVLGYMADTFSKADKRDIINIEVLGSEEKQQREKEGEGMTIEGEILEDRKELPASGLADKLRQVQGMSLRDIVRAIKKKEE